MKTKDVVLIAIIGALYAVLTLGIAPFSYGPIQFRISEFLKVFCLWNPFVAIGIAVGDIISAISSPYLSAWEILYMPITDIIGGFIAYYMFLHLKQTRPFIPMSVYALTTSFSVATMLTAFGVDAFLPLFISISISELIILNFAIPIGYRIKKALEVRQSNALER